MESWWYDAISIHAPHMGRDGDSIRLHLTGQGFQSTRPIWGATLYRQKYMSGSFISIHAPHMGRDRTQGHPGPRDCISIHAPHMGRDYRFEATPDREYDFNPRAPYGARPRELRKENESWVYFNPRAPYGARLP